MQKSENFTNFVKDINPKTGKLVCDMIKKVICYAVIALSALFADAQHFNWRKIKHIEQSAPQKKVYIGVDGDTLLFDTIVAVDVEPLPATFFAPAIFDTYQYLDTTASRLNAINATDNTWAEREYQRSQLLMRIKQRYMIDNPEKVKYNLSLLPEPPKKYVATVDPTKSTIIIEEVSIDKSTLKAEAPVEEIKPRHWLHSFSSSLQFSQAYISPNWYQGGDNSVNMLSSLNYGVMLNQAFFPELLFDASVQYKLGLTSAPSESIHDYLISQDLFLLTSKFGFKAINRWYYTINMSLKTQMFKSYASDSKILSAAFMAPGELNFGVGMTYSYNNAKKKRVFDASLAPLSYNLKTCLRSDINETAFGIREGRHTESQIGSSAEFKFRWNIAYNISYQSRLFAFSNYDYVQGDWENTLNFSINRYLSTQLYVHLRYDSRTIPVEDWEEWQLKEIFSFGFSYNFSHK